MRTANHTFGRGLARDIRPAKGLGTAADEILAPCEEQGVREALVAVVNPDKAAGAATARRACGFMRARVLASFCRSREAANHNIIGANSMNTGPKYPWRLDTNERYREVIRTLMGLSTASLLLPVFFAREFLGIKSTTPLKDIFGTGVYWSWALLAFAVFAGVMFHFLSAKWVRLAWSQPASIFCIGVSDKFVERAMEACFWATTLAFLLGLVLIVEFFVTYKAL